MLNELIEQKLTLLEAEEALLTKLQSVPEEKRAVSVVREIAMSTRRVAKMRAEVESLMTRMGSAGGDTDASEGEPDSPTVLTGDPDQLDAEMRMQMLLNGAAEFLTEHDLYYVANGNLFVEYDRAAERWVTFQEKEFKNFYHEWKTTEAYWGLLTQMDKMGRKMHDQTYSFEPPEPGVLSLMRRDGWLTPAPESEGRHHWFFDVLMTALGGEREENVEHLREVLSYKYRHPECYRLPCVTLYGQGAVGKSLLVEVLLPTIYGRQQVVNGTYSDVLGDFNDAIMGRTIVFLNEAINEKVDMEALKNLVHSPSVTVNQKHRPRIRCGNTPLYLLGGNSLAGAIRLAGDASDRRWSVIRLRRTLVEVLADYMDEHQHPLDGAADYQALARRWIASDNATRLCRDRQEVSKWLGWLTRTYADEAVPQALQGHDWQELERNQRSPAVLLAEKVFTDPAFESITLATLYELYKTVYVSIMGSVRGRKGRNNFALEIEGWLARHRPDLEYRPAQRVDNQTKAAFCPVAAGSRITSSDHRYGQWFSTGLMPTEQYVLI